MVRSLVLFSSLLLAAACGGEASSESAALPPLPALKDTGDPVADMRAFIAALQQLPEQPDESIEVQHVLIAFKGAERATVQRSREAAEKMAADVLRQAIAGEKFTRLMQKYSTDPGSGTYPMTKAGRNQMVAGFGNVGFRLRVGEIGVAPYDPVDSKFGWHVIKRLK